HQGAEGAVVSLTAVARRPDVGFRAQQQRLADGAAELEVPGGATLVVAPAEPVVGVERLGAAADPEGGPEPLAPAVVAVGYFAQPALAAVAIPAAVAVAAVVVILGHRGHRGQREA